MAGGSELPANLKSIRQLGRGAYGIVHLCEYTDDSAGSAGAQVAVKHVKNAARHGKSMLREVVLLARLKHDNLLSLIDFPAVSGPNFSDVFLVLPYYPTDLHKVIQSRQTLGDKHVQVLVCQILRAMSYLHAAGVAHRDLKPANILLSADCRLKVCDFGLARGDMRGADEEDDEDQQECGVLTEYVITRWYRAPEVMLLPKQYSYAVDLWSVGCILGEILARRAIFPGKNHVDMITRVAQVLGTPSDDVLTWLPKESDAYRFIRKVCRPNAGVELSTLFPQATAACLDLLRGLLTWDPAERLTADEAQQHEYLIKFLPKETPVPPEPFDWSFDKFKPTTEQVRERLYKECLNYHPEMLERDVPDLARRSSTPRGRSSSRIMVTPPRQPSNGCLNADTQTPAPSTQTPAPGTQTPARPDVEPTGNRQGGYVRHDMPPQLPRRSSAADFQQHHSERQAAADSQVPLPQFRPLSAGAPPGAPASRSGTPLLSARSSPGQYNPKVHEQYFARNSRPQLSQMAPTHAAIPQPHFRSHVFPGRSLTPQRVLAR